MARRIIFLLAALLVGHPLAAAAAEMMGSTTNATLMLNQVEVQTNRGHALLNWEGEGWIGGDLDKFWLKSRGDLRLSGPLESAEVQALWSHAITPFFDLQAGLRHDIRPDTPQSYAVIGLEGLAPQWIELDAAAFVSEHGRVSARVEAFEDFYLTQRLIAQPKAEVNLAASGDAARAQGSGVRSLELGLRLRYEIRREFAPYIGLSWARQMGGTGRLATARGENPSSLSFVTGLKVWF